MEISEALLGIHVFNTNNVHVFPSLRVGFNARASHSQGLE